MRAVAMEHSSTIAAGRRAVCRVGDWAGIGGDAERTPRSTRQAVTRRELSGQRATAPPSFLFPSRPPLADVPRKCLRIRTSARRSLPLSLRPLRR